LGPRATQQSSLREKRKERESENTSRYSGENTERRRGHRALIREVKPQRGRERRGKTITRREGERPEHRSFISKSGVLTPVSERVLSMMKKQGEREEKTFNRKKGLKGDSYEHSKMITREE